MSHRSDTKPAPTEAKSASPIVALTRTEPSPRRLGVRSAISYEAESGRVTKIHDDSPPCSHKSASNS